MSMDAKARLWYGTRTPNDAAVLAIDAVEDVGELVSLGVHIHRVWCGGSSCGIGGTVAFSWWDEDQPLDLVALLAPVRVAVAAFQAEHGDTSECAVYLTADYS